MELPKPGQRWVSDSEAELGLGIILRAEFGRVEVHFPAAKEQRQYALQSAPLRRVRFQAGDKIKTHDGSEHVADSVEERGGLLVYITAKREIPEAELSDTISFSRPEDRLFAAQVDDLATFDLRADALHRRCQHRQSPARGFAGGRVDLLSHQMYIAGEVASRLLPRVLLADEVGLGKTIEAGLILHRLHLTGRAGRILILVPEPLVHQWFVELLRRFNMLFSLFDEERCESIEKGDPAENPFLDSQLVLCSLSFLADHPNRATQAREAGWDLLVVDEAHHLEWTPEEESPAYVLVKEMAQRTPGVLLLTATPQQLGPEGHFARLRLLDPDRYGSLDTFMAESEHYQEVARAIDRLLAGEPFNKADRALFAKKSERIRRHCKELEGGDDAARERLVGELLDEFGTGRVMFRNTRAALKGFPQRKAILTALKAKAGEDEIDTKVKWLASLLKEYDAAKVLLICRTRELVEDIHARLQREMNVSAGLFHEGLTLLQRDRNAAFFAEEEGARILLCSEIGSEGQNFQFSNRLVLFDLPENPELLEQRIGRLDRIGQKHTIHIYVPYLPGADAEVLARWYHEGLNAFEQNLHGAAEISRALREDYTKVLEKTTPAKITKFLAKSRDLSAKVAKKLEQGHDRLLELNSCKPEKAAKLISQIRALDGDIRFEESVVRLFDHFGLHVEELASRTYFLKPGPLRTDAFPALREEGISVTFDRARGLSREDLGFMSADHPIVRGSWDLLLGSESGNSAFGVWKRAGTEAILLEVYFIVECVAPAALHVDRFLPATPIRIVVDHALADHSADSALKEAKLEKGDIVRLLDRGPVKKKLLPAMLSKAQALGAQAMQQLILTACGAMSRQLNDEIERLEDLGKINNHVRPEEIATYRAQKESLGTAIASANLRTDALRLIFRMPG